MHRADVDGVEEEEGEYEFDDVGVDNHASTFTLVVGLSIAFFIICALSCLLMRERLTYAWRVWNAGSSAVRRTKSMMEPSGARRPQRLQDEHADD